MVLVGCLRMQKTRSLAQEACEMPKEAGDQDQLIVTSSELAVDETQVLCLHGAQNVRCVLHRLASKRLKTLWPQSLN